MTIKEIILEHLLSSNENRILQAEMLALTHDIDIDEFIKGLGYNDIGIIKPLDFMESGISCARNNLTSLPANLPTSLKQLVCSQNKLTVLPDLSQTKIEALQCAHNNLTTFPPNLPTSLKDIKCYENPSLKISIKDLPPNVTRLIYDGEQLVESIDEFKKAFPKMQILMMP